MKTYLCIPFHFWFCFRFIVVVYVFETRYCGCKCAMRQSALCADVFNRINGIYHRLRMYVIPQIGHDSFRNHLDMC